MSSPNPQQEEPRNARDTSRRGGLRVLIVEDNRAPAQSLAALLGRLGFEVSVAADGPAALEASRSLQPDVILLDIGLPGLDGYDVARRIPDLSVEKRTLLIAVTGRGSDADRLMSERSGIDLHLVKPTDPEALLAVLRRFQIVLSPCAPLPPDAAAPPLPN